MGFCGLFVWLFVFFGSLVVLLLGWFVGLLWLCFGLVGIIVHGRSRFGVGVLSFGTLAWFCLFLIYLVCVYCCLCLFGRL